MARLIMWNLVTLDGLFEGRQPWDLAFHEYAWDDALDRYSTEQTQEAGALVFGRRTYEGMAAYWSKETCATAEFMNSVPKYVFSRTLERVEWNASTLVCEDVPAAISRLKREQHKDLFVFGSANLSETLIRHGLYDEYRLGVVPVTLGHGTPLFGPELEPLRLRLLQTRPLGERCLSLRYAPAAAETTAR